MKNIECNESNNGLEDAACAEPIPAFESALPEALVTFLPPAEESLIEGLVESITKSGQLVPIVLDENGAVVDGRKRMEACIRAGVEPVTITLTKGEDAVARYAALTFQRDHWTPSQRAMVAAAMANLHVGANQHSAGMTQAEASKLLNTSPDQILRARKLISMGAPEQVERIVNGTSNLAQVLREVETKQRMEENIHKLGDATIFARETFEEMVEKQARFSVIYADCPWSYGGTVSGSQRAEGQYPTMPTEELTAMDVKSLAAPDAICFLWVPSSLIEDGLEVMNAWGFKLAATAVWIKPGRGPCSASIFNPRHELLFIGRRGKGVPMTRPPKQKPGLVPKSYHAEEDVDDVLERGYHIEDLLGEDQERRHSRKPAWFAEQIELTFPEASKIELFCRVPREGWTAWGNQADGEEARASLAKLAEKKVNPSN